MSDLPTVDSHSFAPPHGARDAARLEALVAALLSGVEITPIVVDGDTALTGSHRIAAQRAAWGDLPGDAPGLRYIDACDEVAEVCDALGWTDGVEDRDELLEALHELAVERSHDSTWYAQLAAALADQI